MKKHILLFFLLVVAGFKSFGQCDNGVGSVLHDKQASYYCHQYVKAALIRGWVNLATGIPTHTESDFTQLTGEIATDPDFIRVCSISDAKAVVPTPYGNTAYHSALILTNGIYASTPSGSTAHIYTHQNPRTFTTACPGNEQYYAAIPNITISGPSGTNQGMQQTFTLTNNGQPFPAFIQLNANKWAFNSTYFTEVPNTRTATSITLVANNVSGSSDVKYTLVTSCNGGSNIEIKSVSIVPNCSGTLNGGPLYTFNTVPTGPNQVVMALSPWTWVRTSGNASWSTSNSGKNMTFTASSGCSSFNAYNSSCNVTFTFCKGSSFSSYSVVDMKTLKVIKEGTVEDTEEPSTLLDGLSAGTYIIKVDGRTTRHVKSN